MRSVWKYTLMPRNKIQMPKNAEILSVQAQDGNICLWALVDTEAEMETRMFTAYGTGHQVHNEQMVYVGTVHLHGGELVFHVFERFGRIETE